MTYIIKLNSTIKGFEAKAEEKTKINNTKNIVNTCTIKFIPNTENINKNKSKENINKDKKNSFLEFSSTRSRSSGNYRANKSKQIQGTKSKSEKNLNNTIYQKPVKLFGLDERINLNLYVDESNIEENQNIFEEKYDNNVDYLIDIYNNMSNIITEKPDDFLYLDLI